jgi:hypothetical protein
VKNFILIVLALLVFASIALHYAPTNPTAVVPSTTEVAPQPEQGVQCTTLLSVDDYYDAVCKNTLGFDTRYTRNSTSSEGSSFRRISKGEYDRALAWKSCIDDADAAYANNLTAKIAAHGKCAQ